MFPLEAGHLQRHLPALNPVPILPEPVAGDVAAGEVITAVVTVAGATLREWLPDDHAGALPRNLGLIAATGGANMNGDSNGIR